MKHLLLVFLLISISSPIFGQDDIVELSISAQGESELSSIHNALRLAIEECFGTFVSANTDLLNDDVTKDEIVTVSSGVVHGYEVISRSTDNGVTTSVLKVKISISGLVEYVKSKGSSCEFAGSTFGTNLKMYRINVKNTQTAFNHLYSQLENLAGQVYDYKIKVGNPYLDKADNNYTFIPISIQYYANKNTQLFGKIISSTLDGLRIPKTLVKTLLLQGNLLYVCYRISLNEAKVKFANRYGNQILYLKDASQLDNCDIYYFPLDESIFKTILIKSLTSFVIKDNLGSEYKFNNLGSIFAGELYSPINFSGSHHSYPTPSEFSYRPSSFLNAYPPFLKCLDAVYFYNYNVPGSKTFGDEFYSSFGTSLLVTDYCYNEGVLLYTSSPVLFRVPTEYVNNISDIYITPYNNTTTQFDNKRIVGWDPIAGEVIMSNRK